VAAAGKLSSTQRSKIVSFEKPPASSNTARFRESRFTTPPICTMVMGETGIKLSHKGET